MQKLKGSRHLLYLQIIEYLQITPITQHVVLR